MIEVGFDEWEPLRWHCVNCGKIVTAYQNRTGAVKVECPKCRTVMVRRIKNKYQDKFDVFAPVGAERLN